MRCLTAVVEACIWACHRDELGGMPFLDSMNRHFLREGSLKIWKSLWKNRDGVVSVRQAQRLPLLTHILTMFNVLYEYDSQQVFRLRSSCMLSEIYGASKVAMKTCGPDLGRLALFVWFHTPTNVLDALDRHRHMAFLTFCCVFIPMDIGKDKRYLETVVSDSIVGAVPLMSKILATIERDVLLVGGELENFISIIEALLSFCSEQLPQFFALPILHPLVLGMARQRRKGGSDWEAGIRVWGAIQRILR